MAFLLDTNLLSELRKGVRANPRVVDWARDTLRHRHYISVLSLGEIRKGIELLRRRSPEQCLAFERWLEALNATYHDEILPVSDSIADRWGRMMAEQTLPVIDGLLAATALEHGLTVATRNIADFDSAGIALVNPFAHSMTP